MISQHDRDLLEDLQLRDDDDTDDLVGARKEKSPGAGLHNRPEGSPSIS